MAHFSNPAIEKPPYFLLIHYRCERRIDVAEFVEIAKAMKCERRDCFPLH